MWCNFVGNAWKALFDLAGGLIREYDQEAMVSVSKFVDQLPSVMNQVSYLYESNLYFINEMCSDNMFVHRYLFNPERTFFPCYLQVTEGVSEFKPTPPENREFCKNSYSVANTLLVLLRNLHLSKPLSVLI